VNRLKAGDRVNFIQQTIAVDEQLAVTKLDVLQDIVGIKLVYETSKALDTHLKDDEREDFLFYNYKF
jgi:hypothetical protein